MNDQEHYEEDIARLLLDAYVKVLRVDLNNDLFDEVKVDGAEIDKRHGYSNKISEWLRDFALKGNVHEEDLEDYLAFTQLDNLVEKLDESPEKISVRYRRRCREDGEFRWVRMMLRKGMDYSADHRVAMLYIDDIQDVVSQEEAIVRTNAMLEEAFSSAMAANSAKSEFMSRMSHDIRTPLNGIIGMTAIAGVHLDEPERVADCLTKITGAGKHLLSLINDILDLSKIESGKVSLTDAEFNLPELIDNLLGMIHTQVEQHNHSLEVSIQNVEHEDVIGDDIRLQQVFTNIVSNAIKYTPDGGKIVISFGELPSTSNSIGRYRFVCEDNGYGMSEEFLEKLFDPFERADNAEVIEAQGTGLGMTIAHNIINMMGGSIQVESRVGVGTRFTVDFKIKLQDKCIALNEELLNLPVLVVDDDEVTCESACIALGELGMRGDYVLSGERAVELVEAAHSAENDYFACLIDWKMPGIDGVETTRRIRRIVGPDVPIIIISAYEWVDIEEEAREAGANAFITKPLFKSRLRAAFTDLPKTLKHDESTHLLDEFNEQDYSGKRLLLVEDNALNREIAQEIMGMTGAEIETAEDGQVAVDMFAASTPGYYDMVFMDIQMPRMDGYEATRAIRALPHDDAAGVPIIALTANAFLEDIELAHEAGMNAHMSKPIEFDKLLVVLGDFLSE